MEHVLRLGTRGSLLARAQSRLVADALVKVHAGLRVETVVVQTSGDRLLDKSLADAGGKGLFTKEIEQALLDGSIDFAVHSFKDVPVTMPLVDASALIFAAVPKREDARDVLVSKQGASIESLFAGAKVGTSSLRRAAQLRALRSDLQIVPIRGNIDTRIRKMHAGEFDAILLAAAGLRRAGLFDDRRMIPLAVSQMLPAAGQGALALQCRADDQPTWQILRVLDHPDTARCVDLEREVVMQLQGDCHSPIAVLAQIEADHISLHARVGARDGGLPIIESKATAPRGKARRLLEQVVGNLLRQNARGLLDDKK